MTPKRKQRLFIIVFGLLCGSGALGLILYGLSENINFFYAPMEIADGKVPYNTYVRAGGLVVQGSVERADDSLQVRFKITDGAAEIPVVYDGILPDLFQEGQGIVAEGKWLENNLFNASTIIAKHDETYMPPEVADALKRAHKEGKANLESARY